MIETIIKLIAFRRQMGMQLEREKIVTFCGDGTLSEIEKLVAANASKGYLGDLRPSFNEARVEILKNVAKTIMSRWYLNKGVLFVGVSGSLAAGTYKEGDDVDIFVVTKDYYAWIYRAFAKLVGRNIVRNYDEGELPDKLCLNFICEQRGIHFESQDIFTLHELIYLEPVYKNDYYKRILAHNSWIHTKYGLNIGGYRSYDVEDRAKGYFFIKPINYLLMELQLIYMKLKKHRADIMKIKKNYVNGRIIFYPGGFNEKVTKQYEVELATVEKDLRKND